METAPLKAFATSARTELIREVTARITAVLGQGSPERVENPATVAGLEKEVAASGGGDKGKAHVADKVAYTWFNRIVALRFMDANGYTGIGVVSPAADQVGQPEVLAAAKRGQIDKEVVSNDRSMAAIAGLLNGTRQSRPGVDAQAEAYSLLLAAYCQFWHKAMPFMFERQGDFTELLIPANLLASDSVLTRSADVLSEDTCKDVEVIGWLYQFYISERKAEVFAGFKKNKKAGADEIPAATQLFTPHWIVRYLVENSLGRLWMLNRPTSGLVQRMDYYIAPIEEEANFLKVMQPEELTVIDPACGSGHMLTYAFDLLYAIYEEEGYAPSDIPGLILANNLYGTEIDPRAGALAAFALTMKAASKRKLFLKVPVEPNISVIERISFSQDELNFLVTSDGDRFEEESHWNQFSEADFFGSLVKPNHESTACLSRHVATLDNDGDMYKASAIDRALRVDRHARCLDNRYAVVVANPPYMGSRNMTPQLAEFAQTWFPDSKSDLCAMFIERCLSLVKPNGLVGMVTMHAWMFIASFEKLRARLLSETGYRSMAHLGTGAFDSIGGEVVATTAFVLSNGPSPDSSGVFVRLVDERGETGKSAALRNAVVAEGPAEWTFVRRQAIFRRIPGCPMSYWLDSSFLRAFEEPSLGRFITTEGQNKTANNDRYLRYHWEISRTSLGAENRWIPYAKGGKFRRWYGNVEYVVDWSDAARSEYRRNPSCRIISPEFWYREGVTWNGISPKGTGFRFLPPGGTFDMGGPTAFLSSGADLYSTIGFLNSDFVETALQAMNPTINMQLKDVRALPFPDRAASHAVLTDLATECIEISRTDWDALETSLDFHLPSTRSDGGDCISLRRIFDDLARSQREVVARMSELEARIDAVVNEVLQRPAGGRRKPSTSITLWANPDYRYERELDVLERERARAKDHMADLASYAIGCMFGRYSLDEPGLILADQGSTLQDYLAKVSSPTFTPDADNVIPIVDGDWFEDDIVGRFRQFLRVAFGNKHFEENLNFVTESLGVKNLREYFITKAGRSKFYDDHVQRYKKRPIYWLFSSPKGSFNALIYLHRYAPSTASTVLTYLREYVTKLESSLQQLERAGNAKESDRLRKILVELNEYEHYTLYPKASENVVIDLDDGVKANYQKLGGALRKIAGLESSGD